MPCQYVYEVMSWLVDNPHCVFMSTITPVQCVIWWNQPWISAFLSEVQHHQCPLCFPGVRTPHSVCLLSDSTAVQTYHTPERQKKKKKTTIIITHYCGTCIYPHILIHAYWQTHHSVEHKSQMTVSKHTYSKSYSSWPPRLCHFCGGKKN